MLIVYLLHHGGCSPLVRQIIDLSLDRDALYILGDLIALELSGWHFIHEHFIDFFKRAVFRF